MRSPLVPMAALAMFGGLSAAIPPAVAQASDPAVAPVKALDDGLIAILKASKAAGVRGRAAQIAPVVDRSFDLPLTTRLAVGSGWNAIAPADQAALVAAMRRLTVAQYASNFDGYSGQSFAIDPRVDARGGDRLVKTTLSDRSGPVSLSYRLRDSGAGWRIIDVFYRNAISQLATRRADFAGVLASGGPKALVAHLNALSAKSGG